MLSNVPANQFELGRECLARRLQQNPSYAADYTVWRNQLGMTGSGYAADGNGDKQVTQSTTTFGKRTLELRP